MFQASEVNLVIRPEDLLAMLQSAVDHPRAKITSIVARDDAIVVGADVHVMGTWGIELAMRVHSFDSEVVRLRFEVIRPPLLKFPLKLVISTILESMLEDLTVEGDVVSIPLSVVQAGASCTFQLRDIRFTPRGIEVSLDQFSSVNVAVNDTETRSEILEPVRMVDRSQEIPVEERGGYRGLRERIERWGGSVLPERLRPLLRVVMLLPDYLVLLYGLLRENRVPVRMKAIIGALIAYILSPIDVIPDVIPVLGLGDDLLLTVIVFQLELVGLPNDVIRDHWHGPGDAREVTSVVGETLREILPDWVADLLTRRAGEMGREPERSGG